MCPIRLMWTHFCRLIVPPEMVDLDRPSTYGAVCGADLYAPLKFRRQRDMLGVTEVWSEVSAEFAARFGREHPPVEAYLTANARVALITIGTASGAARMAVNTLRAEGVAVGSLRLGLMRPFPAAKVLEALSTVKDIVVLDRDVLVWGRRYRGPGSKSLPLRQLVGRSAWIDHRHRRRGCHRRKTRRGCAEFDR